MDNLLLGPEAQLNHAAAALRATGIGPATPLAPKVGVFPGVHLSIDPESRLEGTLTPGGGRILSLDYTSVKTPRWMALHLSVGPVDMESASIFGVVCRTRMSQTRALRVCLRSPTANGFIDAFLPKHIVTSEQASTHVDLMKLEERDDIPMHAEWRDVILFLPTQSSNIELLNIQIFIA